MKEPIAAKILRRWAREDPPQLLQSALQQVQRIEELLEQTQHLRGEIAYLREQLVAKNKRNNLAERQLRPAVIARKISCRNKTDKGARTWQILTLLAATCAQRAQSFIATLARAAPLLGR